MRVVYLVSVPICRVLTVSWTVNCARCKLRRCPFKGPSVPRSAATPTGTSRAPARTSRDRCESAMRVAWLFAPACVVFISALNQMLQRWTTMDGAQLPTTHAVQPDTYLRTPRSDDVLRAHSDVYERVDEAFILIRNAEDVPRGCRNSRR